MKIEDRIEQIEWTIVELLKATGRRSQGRVALGYHTIGGSIPEVEDTGTACEILSALRLEVRRLRGEVEG